MRKINEISRHLERYESTKVFRRVLYGDSTFQDEVNRFYDISMSWEHGGRYGPNREFELKTQDNAKAGKYPETLIEILSRFDETGLDLGKLEYNLVRGDYNRLMNSNNDMGKPMWGAFILAFLATAAGPPLEWSGYLQKSEVLVSYAAMAVGCMGLVGYKILTTPQMSEANKFFWEFERMNDCAERADDFMKEHYQRYFIKKCLTDTI